MRRTDPGNGGRGVIVRPFGFAAQRMFRRWRAQYKQRLVASFLAAVAKSHHVVIHPADAAILGARAGKYLFGFPVAAQEWMPLGTFAVIHENRWVPRGRVFPVPEYRPLAFAGFSPSRSPDRADAIALALHSSYFLKGRPRFLGMVSSA